MAFLKIYHQFAELNGSMMKFSEVNETRSHLKWLLVELKNNYLNSRAVICTTLFEELSIIL